MWYMYSMPIPHASSNLHICIMSLCAFSLHNKKFFFKPVIMSPYSSEDWALVNCLCFVLCDCESSFMRGYQWSYRLIITWNALHSGLHLEVFYLNLHNFICWRITISQQISASPGSDAWAFSQNQLPLFIRLYSKRLKWRSSSFLQCTQRC